MVRLFLLCCVQLISLSVFAIDPFLIGKKCGFGVFEKHDMPHGKDAELTAAKKNMLSHGHADPGHGLDASKIQAQCKLPGKYSLDSKHGLDKTSGCYAPDKTPLKIPPGKYTPTAPKVSVAESAQTHPHKDLLLPKLTPKPVWHPISKIPKPNLKTGAPAVPGGQKISKDVVADPHDQHSGFIAAVKPMQQASLESHEMPQPDAITIIKWVQEQAGFDEVSIIEKLLMPGKVSVAEIEAVLQGTADLNVRMKVHAALNDESPHLDPLTAIKLTKAGFEVDYVEAALTSRLSSEQLANLKAELAARHLSYNQLVLVKTKLPAYLDYKMRRGLIDSEIHAIDPVLYALLRPFDLAPGLEGLSDSHLDARADLSRALSEVLEANGIEFTDVFKADGGLLSSSQLSGLESKLAEHHLTLTEALELGRGTLSLERVEQIASDVLTSDDFYVPEHAELQSWQIAKVSECILDDGNVVNDKSFLIRASEREIDEVDPSEIVRFDNGYIGFPTAQNFSGLRVCKIGWGGPIGRGFKHLAGEVKKIAVQAKKDIKNGSEKAAQFRDRSNRKLEKFRDNATRELVTAMEKLGIEEIGGGTGTDGPWGRIKDKSGHDTGRIKPSVSRSPAPEPAPPVPNFSDPAIPEQIAKAAELNLKIASNDQSMHEAFRSGVQRALQGGSGSDQFTHNGIDYHLRVDIIGGKTPSPSQPVNPPSSQKIETTIVRYKGTDYKVSVERNAPSLASKQLDPTTNRGPGAAGIAKARPQANSQATKQPAETQATEKPANGKASDFKANNIQKAPQDKDGPKQAEESQGSDPSDLASQKGTSQGESEQIKQAAGLVKQKAAHYKWHSHDGSELAGIKDTYHKLIGVEPNTGIAQRAQELGIKAIQASDQALAIAKAKGHSPLGEEQADLYNFYKEVGELMLDVSLDLTPGVGFAKNVYEALTGHSLVNGKPLTTFEWAMSILGVATGGASTQIRSASMAVRKAYRVLKPLASPNFDKTWKITATFAKTPMGQRLWAFRKYGYQKVGDTYHHIDIRSPINNPLPKDGVYARIMEREHAMPLLSKPGKMTGPHTSEAFITAAEDLKGVKQSELAEKAGLFVDKEAHRFREFKDPVILEFRMKPKTNIDPSVTPQPRGLTSPIGPVDSREWGWAPGGRTLGGIREWLIDSNMEHFVDHASLVMREVPK